MKKIFLLAFIFLFMAAATSRAGSIQYIGNGTGEPKVKISFSRSNGAKWEHKIIEPGQTFHVPKDATHLMIDNSPRNPRQNYKVKDGNVF